MPTAPVQGRIAAQYTDLLRQNLEDDWSILVWNPATNTPDEFATLAHEADAIIGGLGGSPSTTAVRTAFMLCHIIPMMNSFLTSYKRDAC